MIKTNDLAKALGTTKRKIHLLTEQKIVVPKDAGHSRVATTYTLSEAYAVALALDLSEMGLAPRKIREMMPTYGELWDLTLIRLYPTGFEYSVSLTVNVQNIRDRVQRAIQQKVAA